MKEQQQNKWKICKNEFEKEEKKKTLYNNFRRKRN